MALSVFDDKSRQPGPADLDRALGRSAPLWHGLVAHTRGAYEPVLEVWNLASPKFGWSLRLKRKDRVILYLTPQEGRFLVGLVLGEKAAKAAKDAGLPAAVLALLDAAPRYAEGRGIRIQVGTRKDVLAVQQLAAMKMAER
ncbi:MAG: DUF3788 family protein [Candidatus Eisenbacteria bacterium]|nr:DUF3788 family protein [Candidatus Eisenbacteria bacterium]